MTLRALRLFTLACGLAAPGCPALLGDEFTLEASRAGASTQGSSGAGQAMTGPGGSASGSQGSNTEGGEGSDCGVATEPILPNCPTECTRCEAGVCIIACEAKDQCKDRVVRCPLGMDCQVSCIGRASCNNATIACTGGGACDVTCGNDDACKAAQVVCGTGPCSVVCDDFGNVCTDAVVSCGANACETICLGESKPPRTACGGSCACSACGS